MQHKTWRLDSDYDGVWSAIEYIITYTRIHFSFPSTHPFAGLGIPLSGDPTFPFFHPLVFFLFIFLGFEQGMWGILLFATFFSGLFFYILCRSFSLPKIIAYTGGIIYMFSGTFAARVASGHISFILTFPLWPLLLLFVTKPRLEKKDLMFFSSVIALFFLSGDIYGCFYAAGIGIISQIWLAFRNPTQLTHQIKQVCIISCGAFLLCSFKVSAIVEQHSYLSLMTRMYTPIFGEGSIHLPFTVLPFIIPWRVLFYDRPFFQRHLGFFFNWYEYYAFITPFPFIFLFFIKRVKHSIMPLLVMLTILSMLFVAQKFPYSPFYFIQQLSWISVVLRVPQRIYLPLTSIVLAILCLAAGSQQTIKRNLLNGVFIVSIVGTYIINIQTLFMAVEPRREQEQSFITNLKNYDSGKYFVLNLLCCTQHYLVEKNIAILNYYAGWKQKDTPSFIDPLTGGFKEELLETIRPRYIIAPSTLSFSQYNYQKIIERPVGTIWKTTAETITPES